MYLKSQLDALPRGAHFHYALGEIARQYFQSEGLFYIDLWPFGGLFIAIISRHAATEVMQNTLGLATQRPDMLKRFFKPITGGTSLFDMHESEWKPWRAVFNKGFQNDYVSSLVPGMIKETTTYTRTLERLARTGEMCYLDTLTLRFMMDMIGKTIL